MVGIDAYDRSARLAPAYLVFSPAAVLVVVLALGTSEWWSRLGGLLVACGAPLLAVQWGRSGGRARQSELVQLWGGRPSTQLLRFRTGGNTSIVERRHEVVERATGLTLPTAEEEERDPGGADDRYEIAVAELRERMRDEKEFPLVQRENVAYGFRRNLWGRKPYGLAIAILVLAACAALLVGAAIGHEFQSWAAAAFAAGFAGLALLVWLTVVTPAWVHEAGEAYAARLLESAVRLPPAQEAAR
jgi:Flp pilus assembly protein TadB